MSTRGEEIQSDASSKLAHVTVAWDVEHKKCVMTKDLKHLPFAERRAKPLSCLDCKERLIYRHGKVRRPHFSHYYVRSERNQAVPSGEKPRCGESWLHSAAKHLIAERLKSFRFIQNCSECQSVMHQIHFQTEVPHRECPFRHPNGMFFRLDIGLLDNEEIVSAIEVRHSHAVGHAKQLACAAALTHFLEVDAQTVVDECQNPETTKLHIPIINQAGICLSCVEKAIQRESAIKEAELLKEKQRDAQRHATATLPLIPGSSTDAESAPSDNSSDQEDFEEEEGFEGSTEEEEEEGKAWKRQRGADVVRRPCYGCQKWLDLSELNEIDVPEKKWPAYFVCRPCTRQCPTCADGLTKQDLQKWRRCFNCNALGHRWSKEAKQAMLREDVAEMIRVYIMTPDWKAESNDLLDLWDCIAWCVRKRLTQAAALTKLTAETVTELLSCQSILTSQGEDFEELLEEMAPLVEQVLKANEAAVRLQKWAWKKGAYRPRLRQFIRVEQTEKRVEEHYKRKRAQEAEEEKQRIRLQEEQRLQEKQEGRRLQREDWLRESKLQSLKREERTRKKLKVDPKTQPNLFAFCSRSTSI